MSRQILAINKIWQQIKNARMNIKVPSSFKDQVCAVDNLLANDKTGIVSTIYNFMIESATVPMKIETQNESLNKFLHEWQTQLLNRNVNLDIPGGLRALSTENYRERWRSSLLALKVIWGTVKFENQGTWVVPTKMWFVNGGAVKTTSDGTLNTRKFSLTRKGKKPLQLINKKDESIFIRKPFTSWHDDTVIPYFVQRGTMFKSLMKDAITQKQSDVIETIIPILLEMKAGSDKLAELGMNPQEEDFKNLKKQITDAKERFENNGDFGDIIASLRHDVNLNYLIPDLVKIFDEKIVKTTDRDLLSSLGLIELQGFGSTRQEAILNPKVLIEEVNDAVVDWSALLEDVMIEMLARNIKLHPTLAKSEIRVIPGTVKAFLTDDMKSMVRGLYDRGLISKKSMVENGVDMNFEVEVERRIKEEKRDLQTILYPPKTQNLEQNDEVEPMDDNNLEDQNKKPGTPESDNFKNAVKVEEEVPLASYETIDALPDNVKDVLSVPAQVAWLSAFNTSLKETQDEDTARKEAWSAVKEKYEKLPDKKKWVKKAKVEDYEALMSPYTFKYFKEVYNTALEQSDSNDKALKSSLSIVERVSKKNKDGIWVKDKTVTKAQLQALDSSNFVEKVLDIEIKEKKLKLIDKLLNSENE